MSRTVLILREPEIRRLLDPASCRVAVEEAFSAYATGRAALPGVINLDLPERRGGNHVQGGGARGEAGHAGEDLPGVTQHPRRGAPAADRVAPVVGAAGGG